MTTSNKAEFSKQNKKQTTIKKILPENVWLSDLKLKIFFQELTLELLLCIYSSFKIKVDIKYLHYTLKFIANKKILK